MRELVIERFCLENGQLIMIIYFFFLRRRDDKILEMKIRVDIKVGFDNKSLICYDLIIIVFLFYCFLCIYEVLSKLRIQ